LITFGKVARALPVSDIYGVAENSSILVTEKRLISKVQNDGGVQIPKEVREHLKVKEGDPMIWRIWPMGQVTVTRGEVVEAGQS